MCAESSCNKRKGIFIKDRTKRVRVFFLSCKPNVFRNILMNGTSALAWSKITVQKRNFLLVFSVWKRLDIFYMARIFLCVLSQLFKSLHVNAVPWLHSVRHDLCCHLVESLVSSCF